MKIAIYGAGGFGREVKWLIEDMYETLDESPLCCFVDDDTMLHGSTVQGLPVLSLEDARSRFPDALIVVAVGYTRTREALAKKAAAQGWQFATLVHPSVMHGSAVEIGEGSIIAAGCILTTDVVIGQHVIMNLACTVGHDAVIEDFVTLAPGCHIAGCVRIGQYSFLGQGVVTAQGTVDKPIVIEHGNTIGLNAIIVKSTDPRLVTTLPPMTERKKDG